MLKQRCSPGQIHDALTAPAPGRRFASVRTLPHVGHLVRISQPAQLNKSDFRASRYLKRNQTSSRKRSRAFYRSGNHASVNCSQELAKCVVSRSVYMYINFFVWKIPLVYPNPSNFLCSGLLSDTTHSLQQSAQVGDRKPGSEHENGQRQRYGPEKPELLGHLEWARRFFSVCKEWGVNDSLRQHQYQSWDPQ